MSIKQKQVISEKVLQATASALFEWYGPASLHYRFTSFVCKMPHEVKSLEVCEDLVKRSVYNESSSPLINLGRLIIDVMDSSPAAKDSRALQKRLRERLLRILKMGGLTYKRGGVVAVDSSLQLSNFKALLGKASLPEIVNEFENVILLEGAHAKSALTSVGAMLEAILRTYLERNQVNPEARSGLMHLWRLVHADLERTSLDPKFTKLLDTTVQSLAEIRNASSSAHANRAELDVIHVTLAANLACAVGAFLLVRSSKKSRKKAKNAKSLSIAQSA